jgi:tetratricopeptide (TPR) repeat protein
MDQNEFIHAYSDDVIFLEKAKRMLEAVEAEKPRKALASWADKLRTASFCRMRIVIMVASIEHCLKRFQNDGNRELLQTYFTRGKRVSNQQRVQALCDAFQQRLRIDPNIFSDYLSIKILRNTIVHGEWNEYDQAYVQERGFPIDTRQFTEEHWKRIREVEQKLMIYIVMSSKPDVV